MQKEVQWDKNQDFGSTGVEVGLFFTDDENWDKAIYGGLSVVKQGRLLLCLFVRSKLLDKLLLLYGLETSLMRKFSKNVRV